MVGEEGLEPSRPCDHKILSLARLPVPPLARIFILTYFGELCYNFIMDSGKGGQSSRDLQKQTAEQIARRKVLAAYTSAAKKAAKKAIKDDLEKKGDELHNKLDELLGW